MSMFLLQNRGPNALIVDDEGGFRGALRELLQEEGIAVVGEADDGLTGWGMAKQLAPDVVLMDLRMPAMGGIEATQLIKASLPNVQVIILTAYDDPSLNRSAEEVGAYAYLVKGCSGRLIRDVIVQAGRFKDDLEERQRRGLS
jgi:two-component system, NarL family, nitrate/nitrite response regulator NarL